MPASAAELRWPAHNYPVQTAGSSTQIAQEWRSPTARPHQSQNDERSHEQSLKSVSDRVRRLRTDQVGSLLRPWALLEAPYTGCHSSRDLRWSSVKLSIFRPIEGKGSDLHTSAKSVLRRGRDLTRQTTETKRVINAAMTMWDEAMLTTLRPFPLLLAAAALLINSDLAKAQIYPSPYAFQADWN